MRSGERSIGMCASGLRNLDTWRIQHDSNSLSPPRPTKNVGWRWIWLDASKPSILDSINVYRSVWTSLGVLGHQFESHSLFTGIYELLGGSSSVFVRNGSSASAPGPIVATESAVTRLYGWIDALVGPVPCAEVRLV